MSRCASRNMTSEERVETLRLYRAGWTFREIAKARGVTSTAIHNRLERWGIERDGRQAKKLRKPIFPFVAARSNGISYENIGRAYFISGVAVFRRLTNAEIPTDCNFIKQMTPDELEAYRVALDVDRLPHRDALEIASDYRSEAA